MSAHLRPGSALKPAYPYRPVGTGRKDSLGFVRKLGQGAGAAILMFAGASTMIGDSANSTEKASAPVRDFSSLNGFAESLATGGLMGPLQILGAIILFVAAGKSIARILGLLIAGGAIYLYLNGYSLPEAYELSLNLIERARIALDAFMTADVS